MDVSKCHRIIARTAAAATSQAIKEAEDAFWTLLPGTRIRSLQSNVGSKLLEMLGVGSQGLAGFQPRNADVMAVSTREGALAQFTSCIQAVQKQAFPGFRVYFGFAEGTDTEAPQLMPDEDRADQVWPMTLFCHLLISMCSCHI